MTVIETERASAGPGRIAEIALDQEGVIRYRAEIEAERRTAIADLLHGNAFRLLKEEDPPGPYHVDLCRREDRLVFEIRSLAAGEEGRGVRIMLNLAPLRRIIHDYFSVTETYFEAASFARPGRLEVIDAGRRALHNDGAQVLRDRLAAQIEIDHETARRLFTLICVLHIKG